MCAERHDDKYSSSENVDYYESQWESQKNLFPYFKFIVDLQNSHEWRWKHEENKSLAETYLILSPISQISI